MLKILEEEYYDTSMFPYYSAINIFKTYNNKFSFNIIEKAGGVRNDKTKISLFDENIIEIKIFHDKKILMKELIEGDGIFPIMTIRSHAYSFEFLFSDGNKLYLYRMRYKSPFIKNHVIREIEYPDDFMIKNFFIFPIYYSSEHDDNSAYHLIQYNDISEEWETRILCENTYGLSIGKIISNTKDKPIFNKKINTCAFNLSKTNYFDLIMPNYCSNKILSEDFDDFADLF